MKAAHSYTSYLLTINVFVLFQHGRQMQLYFVTADTQPFCCLAQHERSVGLCVQHSIREHFFVRIYLARNSHWYNHRTVSTFVVANSGWMTDCWWILFRLELMRIWIQRCICRLLASFWVSTFKVVIFVSVHRRCVRSGKRVTRNPRSATEASMTMS